MILIKYSDAVHYLEEADVLMFRPNTILGKLIAIYGGGLHSHTGLASWNGNLVECVEFREWKGGRTVNLWSQVRDFPGLIDVYRPAKSVELPNLYIGQSQTNGNRSIKYLKYDLTDEKKRDITNTARELTGNDYGWGIICKLFFRYLPFFRLRNRAETIDSDFSDIFVCSTLVSYAYRQHFVDLTPNLNDQYTVPSDISRSSMLSYLFTLVP